MPNITNILMIVTTAAHECASFSWVLALIQTKVLTLNGKINLAAFHQ